MRSAYSLRRKARSRIRVNKSVMADTDTAKEVRRSPARTSGLKGWYQRSAWSNLSRSRNSSSNAFLSRALDWATAAFGRVVARMSSAIAVDIASDRNFSMDRARRVCIVTKISSSSSEDDKHGLFLISIFGFQHRLKAESIAR